MLCDFAVFLRRFLTIVDVSSPLIFFEVPATNFDVQLSEFWPREDQLVLRDSCGSWGPFLHNSRHADSFEKQERMTPPRVANLWPSLRSFYPQLISISLLLSWWSLRYLGLKCQISWWWLWYRVKPENDCRWQWLIIVDAFGRAVTWRSEGQLYLIR